MSQTVLEKFLMEIECPICNNYMLYGISQCIQGHSFCVKCREKLKKCPFCNSALTPGRNYSLENLINTWNFACAFQTNGCSFQGTAISTMAHQTHECEYKHFNCPIKDATNCNWLGTIPDLKKHLVKTHNGISIFHFGPLNVEFLEYYNCLFKVLHRRMDTGNLEWCVQYIGSEKNAEKYMFRLEFIDQSKSGFEAVFTGLCTAYGKDKDAFDLEKISIHEDSLKRFKNSTSYNYRITIKEI